MRAYRVTMPNTGERFTTNEAKLIELMDNDGWCWRECGCFYVIDTTGVILAIRASDFESYLYSHDSMAYSMVQGFDFASHLWDSQDEIRNALDESRVKIEVITID